MLYGQIIQEQIPNKSIQINQYSVNTECCKCIKLLPFMQEMLDSAILKLKPDDKRHNQQLISQSIYLINKTLLNMYKLNIYETRQLIRFFLQELSSNFAKKKCVSTTTTNPIDLLPFMKDMLDSVVLKMKPGDKQKNKQLISQCIYLINKTLVNKFNNYEIKSFIRLFLKELSIRWINKNADAPDKTTCSIKLLPFMKEMLDRVVLKMNPFDKQMNQQIISECIYLINKTLVNKLTSDEIKSLIQLFFKELSERFAKQNKHDCIDNHEEHHHHNDTKEDICDETEDSINCSPIQKPGFFENLTITIPNELCIF